MIVKKVKCDICGAEHELTRTKDGYDALEYPHGWALLHVTRPGLITEKVEDCIPVRYADFEVCPRHGLVEIDIEELTISGD